MGFIPINNKKAVMGYMNANQRPSCRNCFYGKQVTPSHSSNDVYPWRCTRGGFGVTSQAVCNEHRPFQKGATA